MYIHDAGGLVFLPMPRTASKSVGQALIRAGGRRNGQHHALRPIPDGAATFTVIRNPFDALVSWWFRSHRRRGLRMNVAYVEGLVRRSYYFPDPDRWWGMYRDAADVVVRYEEIERGLRAVFRARDVGWAGLPAAPSGQRQGRHHREIVPPRVRTFMEKRYGAEMEADGYGW